MFAPRKSASADAAHGSPRLQARVLTWIGVADWSGRGVVRVHVHTTSEQGNQLAEGYSSLPGLPSNRVNSWMDVHPARVPVGATITVFWVGEIFDNVSGFGQVPSGNYTVVDLAGQYFLDPRQRHRLNVRLENLFGETYATGHGRAVTEDGTTRYVTNSQGVPRTLHVSYTFSY
jgi:outer membrane receptor for ferric coprogen and ferric-rhodotorulic acid